MLENKMKKFGTAIILAGGKSSRMGFDKQFLKIDNKFIMMEVIKKLEEEFDEIIIISNKKEKYDNCPYKVLRDELESNGPLIGIYTGLKHSQSQYAYIIGCDMPNINLDYIRYMKDIIEDGSMGVVTKFEDSLEPFNGFYSKKLLGELLNSIGDGQRSIYRLIQKLKFQCIEEEKAREYSPNWSMFSNLNTPEDLENYKNK